MSESPTIFVVDDDDAVARAVSSAAKLLGHPIEAYSSAAAFLAAYQPTQPGCVVLDIKMPGMTGLELQSHLNELGYTIPIVMISGHADVRIAVETMRRGAITLLEKPFRLDELLTALRQALEQDEKSRQERHETAELSERLAKLTDKEREVLELIAASLTNREIADRLQLSVRAIEDRRARLMKKLGVETPLELARILSKQPTVNLPANGG
ncbi:MAG: response regulator transcription factor [Fimbriiglobus sp.]